MQGAAAALVDSRTRRIMPGGECLCGDPPYLEQVDQLSAFALRKNSLKLAAYPLKQSRTTEFQLVDERVHDKHVCRRRRGKESERLGVSTVSL